MKPNWNAGLLCLWIFMLLMTVALALADPWDDAEFIAEKLSPLIGVKEDLLTSHLIAILQPTWVPHAIFNSIPWMLLIYFTLARIYKETRMRVESIAKEYDSTTSEQELS
jgi:hypothetical protein